jgi:hypothetical protein
MHLLHLLPLYCEGNLHALREALSLLLPPLHRILRLLVVRRVAARARRREVRARGERRSAVCHRAFVFLLLLRFFPGQVQGGAPGEEEQRSTNRPPRERNLCQDPHFFSEMPFQRKKKHAGIPMFKNSEFSLRCSKGA